MSNGSQIYDIPPNENFLIAEFSALRREIEIEIEELGELLRYAILSSGAVWAWLLSQPHPRSWRVAYFLPFVLTALLFGEALLVRQHILRIGDYLGKIERHFSLPDHLGWEAQLSRGLRRKEHLSLWENSVWLLLCVGDLAGAILLAIHSK